ncbi:hypothetical protein CR513_21048, partial [Mucuna pruriens]
MTPIWEYLKNGSISKDKIEAAKVKRRASRYLIEVERNLWFPFKRTHDGILGAEGKILLANYEEKVQTICT